MLPRIAQFQVADFRRLGLGPIVRLSMLDLTRLPVKLFVSIISPLKYLMVLVAQTKSNKQARNITIINEEA